MVENLRRNIIPIVIVVLLIVGSAAVIRKMSPAEPLSDTAQDTPQDAPKNPATGGSSPSTSNPSTGTRYVSIITPNGGETWLRNKQYNIKWDTKGVAADERVDVVLIKTSKAISSPYTSPSALNGAFAIFEQATFPTGLPKEGSVNYYVPDSLVPGTYQMLIWAGRNCSTTNLVAKCIFDLSNGLITIK